MTYPGKPVPLKVGFYFLVGDMPGAVYVNRSTFNVENSGLPKPYGRRLVVAAFAPDYRPSEPAQAPTPWHSKAIRLVNSLSAQVPGIIISHSQASWGRTIGPPSLTTLPNGDYVASHDRHWQVQDPFLCHDDPQHHACQYVDWHFDGEDIIFVSRTAYDDGLGSAHDAKVMAFHRIQAARRLADG